MSLRSLDRQDGILIFKAMLEAAPEDTFLEEALHLARQAEGFALMREVVSPVDYARKKLAKYPIPMKEELFSEARLCHYGEKLIEHNKALFTSYGILVSRNEQTLEQCLFRFSRHMVQGPQKDMEMTM